MNHPIVRANVAPLLAAVALLAGAPAVADDTYGNDIRLGLYSVFYHASADDLRQLLVQMNAGFRDKAPVSAAEAATIILDGVRSGAWRILVGEDAKKIDAAVRAKPEAAYDYAELFSAPPEEPAEGTPEQ